MINMDYRGLFSKYKSKGILIDSNLLLLYYVGLYDQSRIPRFKRTQKYTQEDYLTLSNIITFFGKTITTPHILTEVSNLSGQFSGDIKSEYFRLFTQCIHLIDEEYKSAREISNNQCFNKFGLTDAGIVEIAQGKYLIITDDFPIANWLQSMNFDVVNFNHIRTMNWRNL